MTDKQPRWLEYVPIDDLVPDPRNPKDHTIGDLRASLGRFGYTEPISVDERTGMISSGHGRREMLLADRDDGVAAAEGIVVDGEGRWTVPVVRGWHSENDDEALAYLIAANQLTTKGGWNDADLAAALERMTETPLKLDGIGFDQDELDRLLISVRAHERHLRAEVDPDDVPPVPVVPVTKQGDLWLLGPHRVLCGDARDREDYDRVMNKDLAGAVVTDPPYGVGIDAKNVAMGEATGQDPRLDDLVEGDQGIKEVEELWRASFGVIFDVIPPGCPYYINGPQGGELGLLLLLLLREAKLNPRHILIWVKNRPSFSIGRLDYDYQHEPIVYGWKPGAAHPWYASETRQSVMTVDRPSASPEHPTMKPVALLTQLIENSTKLGAVILDPFGGSGSTLIAAHDTGRRAALVELSPAYVDVICARWQRLTGEKPVLAASGNPTDFLA